MSGGSHLSLIIILFSCSLALFALEAFIPGASVVGLLGLLLILAAAWLCANAYGALAGLVLLFLGAALCFLIFRLISRSMKHGRLARSGLFANTPVTPAVQAHKHASNLCVGASGVAQTALKPSGIADFSGERVHVTALSGFIESDTRIVVVQIEGSKVVVKPAE